MWIVGHRRGIFTATLCLILAILVTVASLSDNAHGFALLDRVHANHLEISMAWVDRGFRNKWSNAAQTSGSAWSPYPPQTTPDPDSTCVKRRWVVKRSFGTLMFARRLLRVYEKQASSSKAMIYLAWTGMPTKRLTGQPASTWRGF